jgi:hypothetical protein
MSARAAMLALAMALAATPARAADPPVPNGMDPGGTAVAIITTGIDYTIPEIAKALARDGEGEIIAWDFVDGDNRPFSGDHGDFGNLMAGLLAPTDLRLVPIRVALGAPNWIEGAASFAARTPAATLVLPMANIPVELERLKSVAPRFPKLSFVVVPRTDATAPSIAAAKGLANVGILAAGMCTGHGGAREAVELIGSRLCEPSQELGTTGFGFAP